MNLRPMARRLVVAALLLGPWLSAARNADPPGDAASRYIDGVRAFNAARASADPEEARGLLQSALAHFAAAYTIALAGVHQARLMEGMSLRDLDRLDEALAIFESLVDSPDPTVRQRADEARQALVEALPEARWARVALACGRARVSVRISPLEVLGDNGALTERLDRWAPCETWGAPQLMRPGRYLMRLRREPEGEGERAYTTSRMLHLDIDEKRTVEVHFELAPPAIVNLYDCVGCGAGPDCRLVRTGLEGVRAPR